MLLPLSSFFFLGAEDLLALLFFFFFDVIAHNGDTFVYLWLSFIHIMVVTEELVASQMGSEQAGFSQ